ncbi:MAG: cell division protein ZipA [Gammaproteobacteria bacterium]|nr:MAG: cell division protein ZipA [Gammaproteobacteria bacterium]
MGGDYAHPVADLDSNSELPNGGARVVRPALVTEEVPISPFLKDLKQQSQQRVISELEQAEDTYSDNGVDQVASGSVNEGIDSATIQSPPIEADVASEPDLVSEPLDTPAFDNQQFEQQESWGNYRDDIAEPAECSVQQKSEPASSETFADIELDSREEPAAQESHFDSGRHEPASHFSLGDRMKKKFDSITRKIKPTGTDSSPENSQEKPNDHNELIVINVESRQPEGFSGKDLQILLEACGMEHGEMMIYHRREEIEPDSPVQFSVANSFEPGYFDPATLATMRTRGVSFFLNLPGPTDNMTAFDYMVETAQCLARNLDGELKDENRSAVTSQTLEHCRQRVREFERKQLSSAH